MELMPGYKRSDVGVIPDEWDAKPLGDIGDSLIGLTYRPSEVRKYGTLVLRSSNVQNGTLCFDDNVFVEADIPERIMVRPGDILVCVRNGSRDLIGKAALIDERAIGMTFGAFMGVFRSDHGQLLHHVFQSGIFKKQINEHLGATINQITNKSLNSFKVPLPPTNEERTRIASALSDVDALLATLDQVVAKKRALKQAAMQQLLTGKTRLPGFFGEWQKKTLGELGVTYGGITGKTKSDFGVGTAKYITFMNVMTNAVIDCAAFDQVNISASETQNRVLRGDLLFNGSSETPEEVAFCSLMAEELPDLYLNSFCFGFRLFDDHQVNGLFLTYYIRANPGREMMKSLAQGSTRYNLSKTALREASVLLPLKDEQVAIAEVLSGLDAELIALEARRDKSCNIKQAMMQQLLTGKTRLFAKEESHV
jgi:type I restriction enzyme S subunit